MTRIPAELDIPVNAAELLAAAKREACEALDITPDRFDATPTARAFAAQMIAHVQTGDHPFCVREQLGIIRANVIVGRSLRQNTNRDLAKKRHDLASLALRRGSKLAAVWKS